jgi:hypothetical protein
VGIGGVFGLAFSYFLGRKPILVQGPDAKFLANWGHH